MLDKIEEATEVSRESIKPKATGSYWPLNFWNKAFSWLGVDIKINRSISLEQD